jgi:Periplasmic binding protein
MYRQGILPSGEPMRAFVAGDIPANGILVACASCHLRSGMGSIEGAVKARPISGPRLYKPLLRVSRSPYRRKPRQPESPAEPDLVRPAYTDATLSRALREGVDPTGRTLSPAMPRYPLDARDMEILIRYLKSLSAETSPGATETSVRFSTVVTEGVDPADRDAMLATLAAYVEDHNSKPPRPSPPAHSEAFVLKKPRYPSYPRLELVRWELKGTPETWREQLDALQRANPVFGLLGGMAAGEWRPIHEFCEEERIPCLFPITELPVVSSTDWHTLYFSRGLYEEGAAAARYLASMQLPSGTPVLEVLRDAPEGRALTQGFEDAWRALGRPRPDRTVLEPGQELHASPGTVGGAAAESVGVFWLGPADTPALWKRLAAPAGPGIVFVSSGLLGEAVDSIPEEARSRTYITYAAALPSEQASRIAAIQDWLERRDLPWTRPAVQSKAYFMGWMLSAALARMRDEFYRDYLLDLLDSSGDQTYAIATYARMSFGPGQRYASKGCYIVHIGPGPRPELRTRSGWIVP